MLRDDHSSSPGLAAGIQQPTRGFIPPCRFRRTKGSSSSRTNSASRASSPLLFGLAPRGVCHALDITAEAVGSYPTFSPLPTSRTFEDVPKVFLRAITGLRAAGGIFSVALSVNSSTGFSLCLLLRRHIPRAPPKLRRLESVLPLPWRYQAHCPPLLAQSGVRTFLPPSPLARSRPAIASSSPANSIISRDPLLSSGLLPWRSVIISLQAASRILLLSAPSRPTLLLCRTSTPGLCPPPQSPSSC